MAISNQRVKNQIKCTTCLSTDIKPTTALDVDEIYELDTGDTYIWHKTSWVKKIKINKNAFSISGIFDNVANEASVNYVFKTPANKTIRLKYSDFVSTATKVRMDFYEAPTNDPTAGSDLTSYNHNRTGTPAESGMQVIKSGVTFDGEGATMLNWQYVPSNIQPIESEWILKSDTYYIRLFTNLSGSAASISFFEYWTEE